MFRVGASLDVVLEIVFFANAEAVLQHLRIACWFRGSSVPHPGTRSIWCLPACGVALNLPSTIAYICSSIVLVRHSVSCMLLYCGLWYLLVSICMYIYIYIYLCVDIYICIYFVYVYICMCVLYVYMYVYI
jgi:hypothetical protein